MQSVIYWSQYMAGNLQAWLWLIMIEISQKSVEMVRSCSMTDIQLLLTVSGSLLFIWQFHCFCFTGHRLLCLAFIFTARRYAMESVECRQRQHGPRSVSEVRVRLTLHVCCSCCLYTTEKLCRRLVVHVIVPCCSCTVWPSLQRLGKILKHCSS